MNTAFRTYKTYEGKKEENELSRRLGIEITYDPIKNTFLNHPVIKENIEYILNKRNNQDELERLKVGRKFVLPESSVIKKYYTEKKGVIYTNDLRGKLYIENTFENVYG